MATLKAQNFELEFSYYNLNGCYEIEYLFGIKFNGKPFFNTDILSKTCPLVKNGKFIINDCWDYQDWLHSFFINILKTKKGGEFRTLDYPEWCFEAITIKNLIKFSIEFPSYLFEASVGNTIYNLSLITTFKDLANFLEDFGKEMRQFYAFFGERIEYLGNGEYQKKDDFDDRFSMLDESVYMIKRCAEWNNESIEPEIDIIFRLLLNDVRWRGFRIVGTVRYILDSTVSENLAKELFALADKKLYYENDDEIRKRLTVVKTVIAIAFPNSLSENERGDALNGIKMEDIPEEIFDKNKQIYLQYLECNC